MTSSPTEPETSPSPSSRPPDLTDPTYPGVRVPPLRVTTAPAASSWTPSPTTETSGAVDGGDERLPPDPIGDEPPADGGTRSPAEGQISGLSLKDLARGLVLAITARIAAAVSKGDAAAAELLVATEKEQAAIADPLAKIGGRHVKTSVGNPDVADLIVAGVAAAGYAFRAVTGLWNLKRHRDAVRAATGDPVEGVAS
jgi:hypothetical protein